MKSVLGFLILSTVSTVTLIAGDAAGIRKAPELAFNLPGEGQRLLSQYRGKVVALEFIMTTCPHCQEASHVMTRYQQEMGSRGLQVIDLAINALDGTGGASEAVQMVVAFRNNFQVGFPVGYVPREQMMNFMAFSMAERMVVPQLVLIDRKGFIHYQTPPSSGPDWEKQMSEPYLHDHLEELLSMGSGSGVRPKSKMVASAAKK